MSGCELIGLSNELLKSFALIHFETEIDASTFYHIYCLQEKAVCPRLEKVKVNPSLIGNQPVIYSSFQVQPRIASSKKILCRCPPNNTGNNNSNPPSITNSNDTSADPSASTTTTTTATATANSNSNSNSNPTSVTNSNNSNLNTPTSDTIDTNATGSTVDDGRDDIEAAKLKIRNSIKRKSEEIAELQKRLRILEQI